MREQNSIIKSVFTAATAFFLCRPVHYPGALAGGRYTQENELKRLAALAIIPASVMAAKYPGGIPGGACIQERPAPRKGVFYTFVRMTTACALYGNIYHYMQTFTIFPIYTNFLLPGRYFAPRYHFF